MVRVQVKFTQDNKTISHSVQDAGVIGSHVFGEACCASSLEDVGVPVLFGDQSMTMEAGQTVVQFEDGKLRPDTNITACTLTFETTGHRWNLFQGDRFGADSLADFDVIITAEWSAYSSPWAYEKRNIATRTRTKTSVLWSVPPSIHHDVVETPDLTSVLRELQTAGEWTEKSTISFIFTPATDTQPGGREFKVLFTKVGSCSLFGTAFAVRVCRCGWP